MKMFLKASSIILSFALVLQCSLLMVVNVSAQSSELVRNGGFENGTETEAYDWGLWPGWDSGSFISTETVHSGSRAVAIALNSQNYALYAGSYNNSVYETHSAITLSAWVKYADMTGGFNFGVERKSNNSNVADSFSNTYTGTSDGWVMVSYDIPATTFDIDETVIKFNINSGSGTLYIDDVSMTVSDKQNILNNAGFEKGDNVNWGCYNAPTFITQNPDEIHNGTKALKIVQGSASYAFWSDRYESNSIDTTKAITMSIWANYQGITDGGFKLIAECAGSGNITSATYTGSSDGWTLITLDLPADIRRTSIVFKAEIGNGAGTVLFDDACIEVASHQNFLKNGGFESGANVNWGLYNDAYNAYATSESYEGHHALKVVMSDTYNFSVWSDGYNSDSFDVTQKMTCSVMLKYENVTSGNIYIHVNRGGAQQVNSQTYYFNGTSDGWVEYRFAVPADTAATLAQMQIEISQGNGTVWFDNAALYAENSQLINYAKDSNASFESTAIDNGYTAVRDWGMFPSWCENAHATTAQHHSGTAAIEINLNESQNYAMWHGGYTSSNFDVNQALVVSAWIMVPTNTAVTGILYLGCERGSYDMVGESLSDYTTNGEWVRITRVLPASDAGANTLTLKSEISAGTGTIYMDDIELYPLTTAALSAANNTVSFSQAFVRPGDPIAVTAEGTEGKITRIYQDGKLLSGYESSTAFMTDSATVLTLGYDDPMQGDANDDRIVDIKDLVRMKRYIVQQADDVCLLSADMNTDGEVNAYDLPILRKALVI